MSDLESTPTISEIKKALKKFAEEARTHVETHVAAIRSDFAIFSRGLTELNNRLLILERSAGTFKGGASEYSCSCGHNRGAHAGQQADGPCLSLEISGDPTDPRGAREYQRCACDRYNPSGIIVPGHR